MDSCFDVLKVLAYLKTLQMHLQAKQTGLISNGVAPRSERHIGFMIECSTPSLHSTKQSSLLLPCRLNCLLTPKDTGLKLWLMAGA